MITVLDGLQLSEVLTKFWYAELIERNVYEHAIAAYLGRA
jgi:hypothetical protein